MPRATTKPANKKCSCSFGYMVLAWILLAVGLYFLVWGFAGQFSGTLLPAYILVYYFVGFLILTLGKMAKCKSKEGCAAHCCK
jgi:hypothetical protein